MPFKDILITEEKTYLNPYETNKEELYTFGKSTAGWVLLSAGSLKYTEKEKCPICFCETDSEPSFELPCCEKKMHAECFFRQLMSFSGKLYRETHMCCPLCRKNYFEGRDRWFWVDQYPLMNHLENVPDFDWDKWERCVLRNHHLYHEVKRLVKEKDDSVPEEERGGWAVMMCDCCKQPVIAGKMNCAEELNIDLEAKYVCDACEWANKEAKDHRCFKHGKKYAMFKCDSCCHVATWDCFSNHYCERCHDMACETKHFPCPGKDKCPLGVAHPKNSHGRHGESNLGFVVGCFKCVDPNYEINDSYSAGAPDPFRVADLNNEDNIGFNYSAPPSVEELLKSDLCSLRLSLHLSDDDDESEIEISEECESSIVEDEKEKRFCFEALEISLSELKGWELVDEDSESNGEFELSDAELEDEMGLDAIRNAVLFGDSSSEEEESSSEEEVVEIDDIYNHFINQFNSSDESETEAEEEIDNLYDHFINQFNCSDESETEAEEEVYNPYNNFINQFNKSESEEESDSESIEGDYFYDDFIRQFEISDSSSESSTTIEIEELAFPETEQQVLPTIPPRAMIYNHSYDSFVSEESVHSLVEENVLFSITAI